MKNNQIKLFILLLFHTTSAFAQQNGCDCTIMKQGQDILKAALNEKTAELETYKTRASNAASSAAIDKKELDRLKGDMSSVLNEKQALITQLSENQTTIKNLNTEITRLKEQLRLKTEEAINNKNEAEKEKSEVERLKADNQKLTNSISGTATGATCINDWLNDRISKTHGKILMKGGVYNLYERNEAAAEICVISFQDNSTTIKQIKVGAEIITDPVMVECMLNRIENLFIHYQDLYFLRFSVRNKSAGKTQLAFIQERYYKNIFEQEKKNEIKEKTSGVELKKLTIMKWSKSNDNSNTISISIALDKEDSDNDFIRR